MVMATPQQRRAARASDASAPRPAKLGQRGPAARILVMRRRAPRPVESLLAADPADERDIQLLAVEIAGEVEQVDLEQRRAIVEGRAGGRSSRRRRAGAPPTAPAPHRCRAAARTVGSRRMLAVGKPSSRPRFSPWLTSPARTSDARAARSPPRSRPAASAARTAPDETGAPPSLTGGTMSTAKPVLAAQRVEEVRRAARVPCRNGNRSRRRRRMRRARCHEDALDESPAATSPARPASKRSTNAPSSPACGQSRSFAGSAVRRNSGLSGAKNWRGCGSKVSDRGRRAPAPAPRASRSDHRPMAAMHAVEIADRQRPRRARPAARRRRRGTTAKAPASRRAQELRSCRRSRRQAGRALSTTRLRGSRLAMALPVRAAKPDRINRFATGLHLASVDWTRDGLRCVGSRSPSAARE